MSDKREMGMYEKFHVERTDGKSAPGEKHDGCQYFVLDVDHDPHALPALRAYVASCESEYPALARDLKMVIAARLMRDVRGVMDGDPRGEPR